MTMLYDLSLEIGSDYAHPVASGRHVLRIAPLEMATRQMVLRQTVDIEPAPESRRDFIGFFGSAATGFSIRYPHQKLCVTLSAQVRVTAPAWRGDLAIALDDVGQALASIRSVSPFSPHQFSGASPRVPGGNTAVRDYARQSLDKGPSVFEIAYDLMTRIHADFTYDTKATTVDTPPERAFQLRRGVCQDFTHVMIMGLRAIGIPAGYVSGYLRTLPPEGGAKLVGADAMHAWVSVWCGPSCGFIEFDPTNRMLASDDHIVAGYGRDYSDIAPLAGTVKSHGEQTVFQRVDIGLLA